MEGHFLVCENEEEEFDISFQVNSTMPDEVKQKMGHPKGRKK